LVVLVEPLVLCMVVLVLGIAVVELDMGFDVVAVVLLLVQIHFS